MIAIEAKNLTKQYNGVKVVDNISIKINEGELFSLLGANGAGKTTAIKMLTGLTKPTSGEALLKGNSIIKNSYEAKNILNISPQETAIAPNLTVKENLEFMAGVYNISNKNLKIEELIKNFKLEEVSKNKAKTLSGGWQRRLSIVMALINEPKILFLDEPTLGLDVIARRELWSVIIKLKEKMTIVLTTHYMEEAEKLSDRVGIMSKGQIVNVGSPQEIIKIAHTTNFEDAFVKLATGGDVNENN